MITCYIKAIPDQVHTARHPAINLEAIKLFSLNTKVHLPRGIVQPDENAFENFCDRIMDVGTNRIPMFFAHNLPEAILHFGRHCDLHAMHPEGFVDDLGHFWQKRKAFVSDLSRGERRKFFEQLWFSLVMPVAQ